MTNTFDDNWPIDAQREIQRLRVESAKHRIERNAARQELAALQAALGHRPEGLLTPNETYAAIRKAGNN